MRRGVPDDAFRGRPQIAIANTASDLTPCNAHLSGVAQFVKNGILEAGGGPLDLPVVSLGETKGRPTATLWRDQAGGRTLGSPTDTTGPYRRNPPNGRGHSLSLSHWCSIV